MSASGPPQGPATNPQHYDPRYHQEQPHQGQPHQHQGQPHPGQPMFDPSAVKLTRGTSCVLCQQRKVRCDKNKPCANCVKANVECRVVPPQPPRRRKKRLQERDLIDRLKKYESLLSENGVKFEPIGSELRSDSAPMDEVEELENDFETLKATPETSMSPSAGSTTEKASENLIQNSSDEEAEPGSQIHKAFDRLFSNEDGFPFIVGGSFISVTNAHPNPIQIFQLWQIYIDNINSLLKITHVPTVQAQVLGATTQLEKAPKNVEALMFGIYLMAITSLEDKDVQRMFNEEKQPLLKRYLTATQQALVNASFLKAEDPLTLQAFVLYLFAVRWFIDPRQLFCLIGMAVRLAQRMGLHRDPGGYGLPPFEVEQRRRLWWVIVGYDRRIGEMTGSTVTALSSGGDCKLPLNVNDSDLHIQGKEMPSSHNGPTEMLFALTRVELSIAVASNSNRDSQQVNSQSGGKEGSTSSASSSKLDQPTFRLAIPDSPTYTLDGFCAHMEGTYLAHCDSKIPLHFFTLTMTRQSLCKMRIINFLVRMNSSDKIPLKEVEREDLFSQATQMIEYDNVVQSSESLAPFRWYSRHHFPFPAYMFLVQELRARVSGPSVERAWDAVAANYELRGLLNNFHNPMHLTFKNTFIKAWDAHESAQRALGKNITVPRFIHVLRERSEQRRMEKADMQSMDHSAGMSTPSHSGDASVHTPGNHSSSTGMSPAADLKPSGPGPMPPGHMAGPRGQPQDMDWSSYVVQGYQAPMPYQNAGSFGSFGMPMGGMPGMGPGPGPGGPMFGNHPPRM
ncbi:unnamed protein product [Clonostachys rosea]|uniref:Zn(2)-C6 fungal-type domain-containing protein n=1 Tax=Bionectria ochroleuca TaxID=29856 RepID=A0ABY6TT54_BIOOC|nr:unnamed protein product [Clonostachys rosea]